MQPEVAAGGSARQEIPKPQREVVLASAGGAGRTQRSPEAAPQEGRAQGRKGLAHQVTGDSYRAGFTAQWCWHWPQNPMEKGRLRPRRLGGQLWSGGKGSAGLGLETPLLPKGWGVSSEWSPFQSLSFPICKMEPGASSLLSAHQPFGGAAVGWPFLPHGATVRIRGDNTKFSPGPGDLNRRWGGHLYCRCYRLLSNPGPAVN